MRLLAAFVLALAAADETFVRVQEGALRGEISTVIPSPTVPRPLTARAFRNIPYAAPPERFKHSQPAFPWQGERNAINDLPGCIQDCSLPPNTCPPVQSEDCLYLNVFTPRLDAIREPLPVMVFIHGGNFYQGYAGGPLYDGSLRANTTNVIVVVMNYRLGVFGFLSNGHYEGNYGITDQRQALVWVQKNIAQFGGDPTRVTLYGQSAGAVSVLLHLLSPQSKGLFHRAMAISAPVSLPLRTSESWVGVSNALAKLINCTQTDWNCFQRASVENMRTAQKALRRDFSLDLDRIVVLFMPFTPHVGRTSEWTQQPLEMIQAGRLPHDVPLVLGDVAEEGIAFIYQAFEKPLDTLTLVSVLGIFFGLQNVIPLLTQYPIPPNTTDMRMLASTIATDGLFLCPQRNASQIIAKSHPNTYAYNFDVVSTFGRNIWGPDYEICNDRICHGADLPYLFASGMPRFFNFSSDEFETSRQIGTYLANLATTGNPNKPTVPLVSWPSVYGTSSGSDEKLSRSNTMMWRKPVSSISDRYREVQCDFWDRVVGYNWY